MRTRSLKDKTEYGSLGQKIFELIRVKILEGEYKDGEKLTEQDLAKKLKVSRTPVREALKQLELEGLVQSVPNKGVTVRGFSDQEIVDILEARVLLERLAIEKAIERITPAQLEELKDLHDLMEFYTKRNNKEKIGELNLQFHEAIYQAANSYHIEQLLLEVYHFISVSSVKTLANDTRPETSLEEHLEIVNALENKDRDRAIKAIEKHLGLTKQQVEDGINKK